MSTLRWSIPLGLASYWISLQLGVPGWPALVATLVFVQAIAFAADKVVTAFFALPSEEKLRRRLRTKSWPLPADVGLPGARERGPQPAPTADGLIFDCDVRSVVCGPVFDDSKQRWVVLLHADRNGDPARWHYLPPHVTLERHQVSLAGLAASAQENRRRRWLLFQDTSGKMRPTAAELRVTSASVSYATYDARRPVEISRAAIHGIAYEATPTAIRLYLVHGNEKSLSYEDLNRSAVVAECAGPLLGLCEELAEQQGNRFRVADLGSPARPSWIDHVSVWFAASQVREEERS